MLATERATTDELRALMEFRIFPTAELAIIRKEVKGFKEFQEECRVAVPLGTSRHTRGCSSGDSSGGSGDAGGIGRSDSSSSDGNNHALHESMITVANAEQRMSEKKLLVMRARRQEEQEARAQLARKAARLKALEDAQAKDPANFRNQRR